MPVVRTAQVLDGQKAVALGKVDAEALAVPEVGAVADGVVDDLFPPVEPPLFGVVQRGGLAADEDALDVRGELLDRELARATVDAHLDHLADDAADDQEDQEHVGQPADAGRGRAEHPGGRAARHKGDHAAAVRDGDQGDRGHQERQEQRGALAEAHQDEQRDACQVHHHVAPLGLDDACIAPGDHRERALAHLADEVDRAEQERRRHGEHVVALHQPREPLGLGEDQPADRDGVEAVVDLHRVAGGVEAVGAEVGQHPHRRQGDVRQQHPGDGLVEPRLQAARPRDRQQPHAERDLADEQRRHAHVGERAREERVADEHAAEKRQVGVAGAPRAHVDAAVGVRGVGELHLRRGSRRRARPRAAGRPPPGPAAGTRRAPGGRRAPAPRRSAPARRR